MLGQDNLLNENWSNFVVLLGEWGSGKKTLIKNKFKDIYNTENNIDGVREVIRDAQKLTNSRLYLFNIDEMTYQAQNALLKITEEPPNEYTYIVIIGTSREQFLPTILSRADIKEMNIYTKEQLLNFTDNEEYLKFYNQPGLLLETNEEIVEFAQKIVIGLSKITVANVFNIKNYIEELDTNLILLIKPLKYYMRFDYEIVQAISKFEYLLSRRGLNFVLDNMFLELFTLFRKSEFKDIILKGVK